MFETNELKEIELKIGIGLSPKIAYQDNEGRIYISKKQRGREPLTYFSNHYSQGFLEFIRKNDLSESFLKQELLVRQLEDAYCEIFVGYLINSLTDVITPNVYWRINEDGCAEVFSEFIDTFDEFMQKKYSNAKKDSFFKAQIKRSDLGLNKEELFLLGQLYCTGLLFDNKDLLNAIDLSNSGFVIKEGEKYPCIVDLGYHLNRGFGAKTADENAFLKDASDDVTIEKSVSYCMPFDTVVFPRLPRQLVPDLFEGNEINRENNIAFLNGIKDLYSKILSRIEFIEQHIEDAHRKAKEALLDSSVLTYEDIIEISQLPKLFYGLEKVGGNQDTLASILKGRIASIESLINAYSTEGPKTMQAIQAEREEEVKAYYRTF